MDSLIYLLAWAVLLLGIAVFSLAGKVGALEKKVERLGNVARLRGWKLDD